MVEESIDHTTTAPDKKANTKRRKHPNKEDGKQALKKQRKHGKRKDKISKTSKSTSTELDKVANPSSATDNAMGLDLLLQDKVFQKEQYQQKLFHLEFQGEYHRQKLCHLDIRKEQYRRKLGHVDIQKEQGQQHIFALEKEIQQIVCRKNNPSSPEAKSQQRQVTTTAKSKKDEANLECNFGMEGLSTNSNDGDTVVLRAAHDDQDEYVSHIDDLMSETTILPLTDSDADVQQEVIIV